MTDDLRAELEAILARFHEDADGAEEVICVFDHYPTSLDCTCHHGHTRHSGKPGEVRCASYWGQPDCDCTAFVPAPASVLRLAVSHRSLLEALLAVEALLPQRDAANAYRASVRAPDDGHSECLEAADVLDAIIYEL